MRAVHDCPISFEAFDKKHEGWIDWIKFKRGVRRELKLQVRVSQLFQVWQQMDKSATGRLSMHVWCELFFPDEEAEILRVLKAHEQARSIAFKSSKPGARQLSVLKRCGGGTAILKPPTVDAAEADTPAATPAATPPAAAPPRLSSGGSSMESFWLNRITDVRDTDRGDAAGGEGSVAVDAVDDAAGEPPVAHAAGSTEEVMAEATAEAEAEAEAMATATATATATAARGPTRVSFGPRPSLAAQTIAPPIGLETVEPDFEAALEAAPDERPSGREAVERRLSGVESQLAELTSLLRHSLVIRDAGAGGTGGGVGTGTAVEKLAVAASLTTDAI